MIEIAPRLTYSPDGILELHKTRDEEIEYARSLGQHKEKLDSISGYEITEDEAETIVRVVIPKVIRASRELSFTNPSAARLIANLVPFTYFDYRDPRDGVFSLEFWSHLGGTGVIFPQFQRWLNNGGFDEDTARNCLSAMAYPFGQETRQGIKKNFKYESDGENAVAGPRGFYFGGVSRRQSFNITLEQEIDGVTRIRHGEVDWNWIDLTTIGSCACWGASWQERERVYISDKYRRLYEMGPHNVDFAVQSLSLTLGMGALAYAAASYEGTEDILENTTWQPEKWHPLPKI